MAGLTENIVVSPLRAAVVEVKCRDVVNSAISSAPGGGGFVGSLKSCVKSPPLEIASVVESRTPPGCFSLQHQQPQPQRSPLVAVGACKDNNSRGSSSSASGDCLRVGGGGGGGGGGVDVDENEGGFEDGRRSSAERRKKPRRRKTKRKNPYSKNSTESRGKKNMRMREGGKVYEQPPEAPYNSNQFLIEDHNDIEDLDKKLNAATADVTAMDTTADSSRGVATSAGGCRSSVFAATTTATTTMTTAGTGSAAVIVGGVSGIGGQRARVRDASFTSAESDEDFYYSSPEDEEEFLQKEFSNTYQDLHVESLAMMSKPELIQTILQLEEKMDNMQKMMDGALGKQPSSGHATSPSELRHSNDSSRINFQTGISRLALGGPTPPPPPPSHHHHSDTTAEHHDMTGVQYANTTGGCSPSSPSSEDSESDSSSSSETSVSTQGDRGSQDAATTHRPVNGHGTEISDMDAADNT